MPLINRTISNLFGGVSQQPAGIRLDNQCEEMINAYPSITDGLVKRPPSEFISALGVGEEGAPAATGFLFVVDTGGNRIVRRLASDLSFVSQYGTTGSSDNNLVSPIAACASGAYLYILDQGNRRLIKRRIFDLSYVSQIGSFGTGNDQFGTTANSICSDGTYLYIIDGADSVTGLNCRLVKRLCSDLSFVAAWGHNTGDAASGFNIPEGISTHGGYLYIGDNGSGIFKKHLCSDLSYVSSVAYSTLVSQGDSQAYAMFGSVTDGTFVWVENRTSVSHLIKLNCSDLSLVWAYGTQGAGDTQFFDCRGTMGKDSTYLYLADRQNNRIKKHLLSTGAFVASIGTLGVGNDQFTGPTGLAYGEI